MKAEIRHYPCDDNQKSEHRRKMDFGIGEFLKYFDEHFGKTATKIFVAFIALAIVGVCAALIWDDIIKPIYVGARWFLSESNLQLPTENVLLASIMTGLSAALIYYFAFKLIASFLNTKMIKLIGELRKMIDESKEARRQMDGKIHALQEINTKFGEVKAQCEDTFDWAKQEIKKLQELRGSTRFTPPSS